MRIQMLMLVAGKECRHILRDGKTLLMLMVLPALQVLIIGFTISNELREVPVAVLHSEAVPEPVLLKEKIRATGEFKLMERQIPLGKLDEIIRSGQLKAALVLSLDFERQHYHPKAAQAMIITDGSNPNEAALITANLKQILKTYSAERGRSAKEPGVDIRVQMLYNPELKAAPNYLTGIISVVLMLICVMMTANAMVREKEDGSIVTLLLGGITRLEFIVGKVIPYLVFSLISIAMIVWLSTLLMGLPNKGNPVWVALMCFIFILTCLSLGVLVASLSQTQESALLLTLIGMVIPTFMFSGFMFPLGNMPMLLQGLSYLVPSRYFYDGIQALMVRGLGLEKIWSDMMVLVGMAVGLFMLALGRFKKDEV